MPCAKCILPPSGPTNFCNPPRLRFEFDYDTYEVETGHEEFRLTEIRDRRGSTGTLSDLVTTITRNTFGVPEEITAPFGQVTDLEITNGYLTEVCPPSFCPSSPGPYTLGYDSNGGGLLTSMTDPNGGQHDYEYDTAGRLWKDRDPATPSPGAPYRTLDRNVTFANNVRTATVTLTTAEGLITQYITAQDPGAKERSVVRPDGTQIDTLWNLAMDRQTTFPDGTKRFSVLVEDPRFGMAAASAEETLTLVGGTTPKQLIVRVERQRSGGTGIHDFNTLTETRRIKKDTTDSGLVHTTTVDKLANPDVILETSPGNRMIKRELDAHGRVVKIGLNYGTPEVAPLELTYDNSGRLTVIKQGTNPNTNRQTTLEYDATSGSPSRGYLKFEKRGTTASPSLFVTEYVTDALGRVLQIFKNTTGDGTQLKLGYDGNSNVTAVQTPLGSSTFNTHSLPHLLTNLLDNYDPPDVSGVSPDVVDYQYDKDRQLTKIVWATTTMAGNTGLEFFPSAGKPDVVESIATSTVLTDYGYDGTTGKLTSIVAGTITTNYGYTSTAQPDWGGLLFQTGTTWSTAQTAVIYTYDDYLRVGTETVQGTGTLPDGQTIAYSYDADSLITSVQVGSLGTLNLSNRSTQSGRLNAFSVGVVTTSIFYDPTFGDVTALETTCTGSTCTQSINCGLVGSVGECFIEDLTYDALGRIQTRTDTVKSSTQPFITYTYDTKGRLSTATPNGGSPSTYVFDQNGNRTSAPSQTFTYDVQDRISTSGYQHDNDGRMTSPNGGSHLYTWDDFGSLISVDLPGNVRIEYTYDGLQRRVTRKKLLNSSPVNELRYLYAEDGRLVAVLDNLNNVLEQYIYATGSHTPDAVVIDNLELYRIVQDHLGSVRMVVQVSNGAVAQRVDYDAFGTITTETGPGFQAFGFAGGLVDADTGLVQMGARWYRPAIGRFISKDPTLFHGGQNLYAYANSDPVNFVDSNGNFAIPAYWIVVGGAAALATGYSILVSNPDYRRACGETISGIGHWIKSLPDVTMPPFRQNDCQRIDGPTDDPGPQPFFPAICKYRCLDGFEFTIQNDKGYCEEYEPRP